ncbi:uncharacterized protein [Lolium perenne]|uniref:uncharacterized protein n=1 Tax=Lolium perenne TaxID=4522 RepID=UPI0021F553FE|nr:uncharacterized protein LOC127303977 [Lolium perenne]
MVIAASRSPLQASLKFNDAKHGARKPGQSSGSSLLASGTKLFGAAGGKVWRVNEIVARDAGERNTAKSPKSPNPQIPRKPYLLSSRSHLLAAAPTCSPPLPTCSPRTRSPPLAAHPLASARRPPARHRAHTLPTRSRPRSQTAPNRHRPPAGVAAAAARRRHLSLRPKPAAESRASARCRPRRASRRSSVAVEESSTLSSSLSPPFFLPRPIGNITTMGQAQGRSIAWLYKHMEEQKKSTDKPTSAPVQEQVNRNAD